MHTLVISNPVSGGREKDLFLRRMKKEFVRFGIDWDILTTSGKNDEEYIRLAIAKSEPQALLVVGGDGTLNLAAKSIVNKPVSMGIIPYGSANGMAAELGIGNDPDQALEIFLKSRLVRETDILLINKKFYCIHIGDVGLNAQIVEGYYNDNDRGLSGYARHFLHEITQPELIYFRIDADGKEYKENGYMLAFANARKYGTGVTLNWQGDISDGIFELVIIKNIELKTLILAGLSRFNMELAKDSMGSVIIPCRNSSIKFEKPVTAQVDGELIGKYEELEIEILPKAIKIITAHPAGEIE